MRLIFVSEKEVTAVLITGQKLEFGKYGTVEVTVLDPNVTPEAQKRREDELRRVAQVIAEKMIRT